MVFHKMAGLIDLFFTDWFFNHFLLNVSKGRQLLLILDGHTSPDVIYAAFEKEIIRFVQPPNTIHLSQHINKGVFGPLKVAWQQVSHDFMAKNPGRCITHYDFSLLLSDSWSQAMTM